MKNGRLTWDELWMMHARAYALRSSCVQYKIGVVFVRDNCYLSGGYNGPPRGEENCSEVGCAKLNKFGNKLPAGSGRCRGAHAEMNAIVNFGREGGTGKLKDSTMFCTFTPCLDCAKHLRNLGIKEIVYEEKYNEVEGKEAIRKLKQGGIKLRRFKLGKDALESLLNFNPIQEVKI